MEAYTTPVRIAQAAWLNDQTLASHYINQSEIGLHISNFACVYIFIMQVALK